MRSTRGGMLGSLGAVGVLGLGGCAVSARHRELGSTTTGDDGPWQPAGWIDDDAFPSIAAGDATADRAASGVRPPLPTVTFAVVRVRGDAWVEDVLRDEVPVVDGVGRLEARDLSPDTEYRFVVHDPSGERRSRVGRIRTALADGAS